jgi:hypothetical protein
MLFKQVSQSRIETGLTGINAFLISSILNTPVFTLHDLHVGLKLSTVILPSLYSDFNKSIYGGGNHDNYLKTCKSLTNEEIYNRLEKNMQDGTKIVQNRIEKAESYAIFITNNVEFVNKYDIKTIEPYYIIWSSIYLRNKDFNIHTKQCEKIITYIKDKDFINII